MLIAMAKSMLNLQSNKKTEAVKRFAHNEQQLYRNSNCIRFGVCVTNFSMLEFELS